MVAYGTLQTCVVLTFIITDGHDIEIEREPTIIDWVIVAILRIASPLT